MDFEYKIIEKSEFLILTFKGRLTKESRERLEACHQELTTFEAKTAIIYFKEVSGVDHAVSRELTILQQNLRKKNKNLFVVGLNTNLKKDLIDRGLVRLNEIKVSLEEIVCHKAAA